MKNIFSPKSKKECHYFTLQISLISNLVEDRWILISASAFNSSCFSVKVYEENLASEM